MVIRDYCAHSLPAPWIFPCVHELITEFRELLIFVA